MNDKKQVKVINVEIVGEFAWLCIFIMFLILRKPIAHRIDCNHTHQEQIKQQETPHDHD